jgi:WD40 repeat protein
MVSDIEPPLSICRLQWLDMRQCFPTELHKEQYSNQFEHLLRALTEKQVQSDGVQQRLLNYLQPIRYTDDLSRHLSRFTGRAWVNAEVENWLASTKRILWITGEAGVGKSALAAWLCDKRPEIAAYHFCHFGNTERTDTRRTLFSLAYQLGTQLPVYWNRLNASPLDMTIVETNVPAIFDRLFVSLLTDAVPLTDKPHVLLIDGLDEATSNGKNELAFIIGHEFSRMPSWIRAIVTSRPHEKNINFLFQALDPWKVDAGRKENISDIREYLGRELRWFTGHGAPSEAIVQQIVRKSEGLFLYVSWVRQALEDGHISLKEVEKFPQGLGGIYAEFFLRYFPDLGDYDTICRPALEAICTVREPIERSALASLLGRSEYEMRQLMARLGSLFPVVDGSVRPFHDSVREWLVDPDRAGDYWINVSAQEQRLADLAWREYQTGVRTMGGYCIKYAPSHLAACQRRAELRQLLLDPEWIQAKLRAAGVVPLLSDYDVALDILSRKVPMGPEHNDLAPRKDALELVHGALQLSSNAITKDPGQFASQVVGRLVQCRDMPVIDEFIKRVAGGVQAPWLHPLRPGLHPPGTALLCTLVGHSSNVKGVALSGDGRIAVSASADKTLKVWEVDTGREQRTLSGHSSDVYGVALSDGGRVAVSASADKTLKVWDLDSGRELRTLRGHSDSVNGVALHGGGRIAVSASTDRTLKTWEVETGRELLTLTGHTDTVNGVALSGDGRIAVSASWDKMLKVWDVGSGHELRTLAGHTAAVWGVALSGDGRTAVSASADHTLKVWEVDTGRELRTLTGHKHWVAAVALSEDGRIAVSASWDSTLKLWEIDSGRELRLFAGHFNVVNGVALSSDGRIAVSASLDRTLKVWQLASGRELGIRADHTGSVTAVALSRDGRVAVSASEDRTLKVWELASGRELATLGGDDGDVTAVALSGNGRIAVSSSLGGALQVWEVDSGRELRTLKGHEAVVNGVALSRDGRIAVSASSDFTLRVWDVDTGREVRTFAGHADGVNAVALSGDGRIAVSASWDKTLKVWEVDSGREMRSLTGHTDVVRATAVSGDGRIAISASWDKTLKVWEVGSGRELRTLTGHTAAVWGVALSCNGQIAVSASDDNTLKVWNLETGEVLTTFTYDGAWSCCAFCDALELVVAGDVGGHVHFLRLETPEVKS